MQIVSLDSNKAREDTADFNSIIMVKLTQNPYHMLLSNPQLLTFFPMLFSDRKEHTSFGLKHLHSNTNLEQHIRKQSKFYQRASGKLDSSYWCQGKEHFDFLSQLWQS